VFFDRTKPIDQRPEVIDIFGSAISNTAEMKTMSYERFGRDLHTMNTQASLETVDGIIRRWLNISFEWSIFMTAQRIIDELQIMQEIFTKQITVMRDSLKALETIKAMQGPDKNGGSRWEDLKSSTERASILIANMEMRREELANLERLQAKTKAQVSLPQGLTSDAYQVQVLY
jgi:hypothetical protein